MGKSFGGISGSKSRFGWVLSGGLDTPELSENVNSNLLHTVHSLRISTENNLKHSIAKFWDLETMGALQKEKSRADEFVEQIKFNKGRYEVKLPFKQSHPPLPDNYEHCEAPLCNKLKELRNKPELLKQYDAVFREQKRLRIIKEVNNAGEVTTTKLLNQVRKQQN